MDTPNLRNIEDSSANLLSFELSTLKKSFNDFRDSLERESKKNSEKIDNLNSEVKEISLLLKDIVDVQEKQITDMQRLDYNYNQMTYTLQDIYKGLHGHAWSIKSLEDRVSGLSGRSDEIKREIAKINVELRNEIKKSKEELRDEMSSLKTDILNDINSKFEALQKLLIERA